MSLLRDFKQFAVRGNVIDLAVGVVIGATFTSIVNAVVDDILMPIVGIFTGRINFKARAIRIGTAEIKYGMFIQATVTFLITAFFLFLIVRVAHKFQHKNPSPPPAQPSSTDKLLMDIRDQLEKANSKN